MIDEALAEDRRVNLLTGVHGHPNGMLEEELGFLDSDLARWGGNPNINIQYIKGLTPDLVRGLLNSSDVTVGGFCNSAVCLAPY